LEVGDGAAGAVGQVGGGMAFGLRGGGGLAGFALARSRAPFRIFNEGVLPPRCWPELGLFDMIQTRCVCGIWDVAWFVAVGAPRLVIGVVGMAVTLAADAVRRPAGFGECCALAGLVVMSAGVMFGYFVGFRSGGGVWYGWQCWSDWLSNTSCDVCGGCLALGAIIAATFMAACAARDTAGEARPRTRPILPSFSHPSQSNRNARATAIIQPALTALM